MRVWSFDRNQEIAPAFFHDRLKRAIQSRNFLISGMNLSACRLVNSESDGLLGLIVDRYGEFLVCQSREHRFIRRCGQSADHPVALNFPEGHYLKGLLIPKI